MVSDGLEFFLPPTLAEAAFVYGSGFVVGKGVSGYRYLRGGVTTHTAESIVVRVAEGETAKFNVKWVDEPSTMSAHARKYNDSASGARSSVRTKSGQAPSLEYLGKDGKDQVVRFDGLDNNVLIDRKVAIVTTDKSKNQALRQSTALQQNGMTGRWEVPNDFQKERAIKMLKDLSIYNIDVRVVPNVI